MKITLATLPQATAQEVFNQVAEHLLTQNARSIEPFHGCRYKDGQGRMCAAGCLIAPEEYKPEFEGKNWTTLEVHFSEITRHHSGLIRALQITHDNYEVAGWPLRLLEIAQDFDLDPDQVPLLSDRVSQLS